MKNIFKQIIIRIQWWQVNRLRSKYNPIVIGVAGSVGKTSAKSVIAKVLSRKYRVQWQNGNFNDIVSAPYVFFGISPDHLFNPVAWFKYFISAERMIRGPYEYDVVVLELGTDKPGDMTDFKKFLRVDYGVLTAISPEHMENFTDLDEVASEELIIADISKKLIVDADSIPLKYIGSVEATTVSTKSGDWLVSIGSLAKDLRRPVSCSYNEGKPFAFTSRHIGRHSICAQVLALAMAKQLDIADREIKNALEDIRAFPGRMQVLEGKNGSVLIDDTYNASPGAVKAALDTLYEIPAKQKIVILGQMNELGSHSKRLHQEVGESIKPKEIDLLVTVGADSNNFIAQKAEAAGCKVVRCVSALQAAEAVLPLLNSQTTVLLKGSQNRGFIEEAAKILLANSNDSTKLVRQTEEWLRIKKNQFKELS